MVEVQSQNCINVIGASGTHGTQVFGAIRIKAYGVYDGAMLQVYIQNGVAKFKHIWLVRILLHKDGE